MYIDRRGLKRYRFYILNFLAVFLFSIMYSYANLHPLSLKDFQEQLVDVVARASKSVVTVYASGQQIQSPLQEWYEQFKGTPFEDFFRDFWGPQQNLSVLGSGVIVKCRDNTVYIITNSHVVAPRNPYGFPNLKYSISIKTYDGTIYNNVEIVDMSRKVDLALLKIETTKSLQPIEFADSSKVKVGQLVIAIGNPFGLESTVTLGIISATGRKINTIEGFTLADLIQTDAALNPGNSGGALVDIEGKLVGINTAIYSPTHSYAGIGFAVPSNIVKKFIQRALTNARGGRSGASGGRPFLGIMIRDLPVDYLNYLGVNGGVIVVQVMKNSPASKAGILPQDIIIGIDGQPVYNSRQLIEYIESKEPGDVIKLRILRSGRVITLKVRLGRR